MYVFSLPLCIFFWTNSFTSLVKSQVIDFILKDIQIRMRNTKKDILYKLRAWMCRV